MFWSRNKAAQRLEKMSEQEAEAARIRKDEQLRLAAQLGLPEVSVAAHPGGTFMKIDTVEMPLRFIEEIRIGHRPWHNGRYYTEFATLALVMSSGRKIETKVNPYNLEATFALAIKLWRAGETPMPVAAEPEA